MASAAGAIAGLVDKSPGNSAVRLAAAILLFWLAGLCFFIAFGSGESLIPANWSAGEGLSSLREGIQKIFQRGASDVANAKGGS